MIIRVRAVIAALSMTCRWIILFQKAKADGIARIIVYGHVNPVTAPKETKMFFDGWKEKT